MSEVSNTQGDPMENAGKIPSEGAAGNAPVPDPTRRDFVRSLGKILLGVGIGTAGTLGIQEANETIKNWRMPQEVSLHAEKFRELVHTLVRETKAAKEVKMNPQSTYGRIWSGIVEKDGTIS